MISAIAALSMFALPSLPSSREVSPSVGNVRPCVDQSAVAFFPLSPGLRRTYSDTARDVAYSDLVEDAVTIDGLPATPLARIEKGRRLSAVFYRATGEGIDIVAFDPKTPLKEPQPFFKIGKGKTQWSYKGLTSWLKDPVPIELTGDSRPGGNMKVLGSTVETLIVRLDATVGRNKTEAFVSHQEIVLGKGIGMIEKHETVTVGSRQESHVVKLVSFEQGKGS